MRIYEDLTLKEIGKTLNLTEGRISQILRDALTKLRKTPQELPNDPRQLAGGLQLDSSFSSSERPAVLPSAEF
jgi:hypothetical protein